MKKNPKSLLHHISQFKRWENLAYQHSLAGREELAEMAMLSAVGELNAVLRFVERSQQRPHDWR